MYCRSWVLCYVMRTMLWNHGMQLLVCSEVQFELIRIRPVVARSYSNQASRIIDTN